jgi:hypothetical protein
MRSIRLRNLLVTIRIVYLKDFSHPASKEKTQSDINNAINTAVDISRNEWKYGAELSVDMESELGKGTRLIVRLPIR